MDKPYLLFRFVPTMRCNYRCDYCFLSHQEKQAEASLFDAHPAADWVTAMAQWRDYAVQFYCWGGEPFLLDGTYEVVKGWCAFDHVQPGCRLDTNMFFAEKIATRCPTAKVKLNCSWHTQYDPLDRIVAKVKRLRDLDMVGMVNFVASRQNLDTLRQRYDLNVDQLVAKFADLDVFLNVAADFARVQDPRSSGYAEYKEFISQYTCPEDWRQLRSEKSSSVCLANRHFFTVHPNGDLTPCLGGSVCGNFFTGTLKLPPPAVCHSPCPSLVAYPFRTDNSFPFTNHLVDYIERNRAYRATRSAARSSKLVAPPGSEAAPGRAPATDARPPRVSVVLPTFNHLAFLPQAVESVLAQTLPDFELIIVNDGSTDGTREYLETLTDPRVRVIHQENQRLPRALNAGFAVSRAPLLTWVSADNVCTPIFLDALVAALDAHPECALAVSAFGWMDAAGLINGIHRDLDLSLPSLLKNNPGIAAFLYRRKCLDVVGPYAAELEGAEDWDMWLRIRELFAAVYVDDVLCYYRKHADSMTVRLAPRVAEASRQVRSRAVERSRGQWDLEGLYPCLKRCADRPRADAHAAFDLGSRLLASTVADPGLASRFFLAAFETLPEPAIAANLMVACAAAGDQAMAGRIAETLRQSPDRGIRHLVDLVAGRAEVPTSALCRIEPAASELLRRMAEERTTFTFTKTDRFAWLTTSSGGAEEDDDISPVIPDAPPVAEVVAEAEAGKGTVEALGRPALGGAEESRGVPADPGHQLADLQDRLRREQAGRRLAEQRLLHTQQQMERSLTRLQQLMEQSLAQVRTELNGNWERHVAERDRNWQSQLNDLLAQLNHKLFQSGQRRAKAR